MGIECFEDNGGQRNGGTEEANILVRGSLLCDWLLLTDDENGERVAKNDLEKVQPELLAEPNSGKK